MDGKEINGCTNLPDPEGGTSGYWCRTLDQEAEDKEKSWGKCDDSLNTDAVRAAVVVN